MVFFPNILKNPFLTTCILISVFIRIALFFIVDLSHQNAWEYGIIAQNLLAGKGYSFFYLEYGNLVHEFSFSSNAQPSAYMPPGYVFFLVPFFLISTEWIRNGCIFIVHNLLSLAAAYFWGQAIAAKTNRNIAHVSMGIMLIFPEFIYANFTIGTTILYHFLLSLIFYFLIVYKSGKTKFLVLAFIFALSMLVRSELFFFMGAIFFVWVFEKKYHQIVLTIILVGLLYSPWAIRNYLVFHKFIPFATNSGINLYRGNNLEEIGTWPKVLHLAVYNDIISRDLIEPGLNKMYFKDGIAVITQHPLMVMKCAAIKIFRFWIIDWGEPRTHHFLYWFPWCFFLTLSVFGIWKFWDWEKYKIEYLFLTCSTFIVVVFFPLVRYQTMMKFVLVPFVAMGIDFLYKKYVQKINGENHCS